MNPTNSLADAKRRLPLPDLMAHLGHGDHAKKSAQCPFHEDSSPSFSVWQSDGGAYRFKCHAGCGDGDEIDYLAKVRNVSTGDAIREFRQMADVGASKPYTKQKTKPKLVPQKPPAVPFAWSACVDALTPDKLDQIADWRGYSRKFTQWLHKWSMIGIYDGNIAFPVIIDGAPVRCHFRVEDGRWFYTPKGSMSPMIFGDPETAGFIFAFESPWDALAFMDRHDWHAQDGIPDAAVIVTRGAQNGRLLKDHGSPDAILYAFPQNDPAPIDGCSAPAEKWLADVIAQSPCKVIHVRTPESHKDVNEWTKAGASKGDIAQALLAGKQVGRLSTDNPSLPKAEDEQGDPPFPIEAFPPAIRDYVEAVADSERLPVVLPAAIALSVASAAVGAGLSVQSGPNRKTRANLFLLISARSGLGKSTAFELLTGPLREFEAERIEHWRIEERPRVQTERRILEKEIANLEKLIKPDSDEQSRAEIKAQMQRKQAQLGEVSRTCHSPRMVTEDVTIEALPRLMEQNRETLYSQSSDARKAVQNLLGRYNPGKGADDGFYLKGFTGEPFIEDRKDKEPLRLAHPCLSLLWLFQPDILETLFGETSLQVGGFLPRCLVAHTNAAATEIGGESVPLPDDFKSAWSGLIHRLLVAFHVSESQQTCKPSSAALDVLCDHYNANIRRQNGDLRDVESFVSRWTEQAWRIAVTFHACKFGDLAADHSLSVETAREAIAVADWFADQQLEILNKSRRASFKQQADAVLELMEERRKRRKLDYLKARDIYHDTRICRTPQAARDLLERMEATDILAGEDVRPSHGGKTTRIYRLKSESTPITV